MTTITINQQIVDGNLFADSDVGFDFHASARCYASECEDRFIAVATEMYPGADVQVDQDICFDTSGYCKPLMVTITDDEDQYIDPSALADALQVAEEAVFADYESWSINED